MATSEVATNLLKVKLGQRLTLNCSVAGSPLPKSIEWLHNGRVLLGSSSQLSGGSSLNSQQPRIGLLSQEVLHINKVTHSDSGSIFQCYVRSDYESAQANVQLKVISDENEADSQEDSKENENLPSWHHQQKRLGKFSKGGHRSERDSGLFVTFIKILKNNFDYF